VKRSKILPAQREVVHQVASARRGSPMAPAPTNLRIVPTLKREAPGSQRNKATTELR
jgi:hypothetical protein